MTAFITTKANVSNGNEDAEMENRRQTKNWKAIVITGLILLCCSMVLNVMVLVKIKNIAGHVRSIRSDVSDIDRIKSYVYYIDSIKRDVESIKNDVDKILRR